ncbi:MAG: 16S rRNA (guanine(966)-N(2))-methyltransferase RsmD [Eggerthellaceae bacterium]|nr:16S rRNA (guanine(966)-N(2))-methyltransferase RsmD [Eggerthellaceae bacterium]
MRIVAGSLRGKTIDAPTGEDTRPTTDRVREALFSSLYSLRGGFDGAVVLDAFAGSGALGIEALSRGAARAVFFERADKAVAVLKRNISSCKLEEGKASVVRRDILSHPPTATQGSFDLVFLDPPYAFEASKVLQMVESMRSSGALAPEAIIVYEHALKDASEVGAVLGEFGYEVETTKKYGKTGVTIAIAP